MGNKGKEREKVQRRAVKNEAIVTTYRVTKGHLEPDQTTEEGAPSLI